MQVKVKRTPSLEESLVNKRYEQEGLRRLFTNQEAAEYLRMSEVTLWRERNAGRINCRRSAGKLLYTLDDLNLYLETVKNAPAPNARKAVAAA